MTSSSSQAAYGHRYQMIKSWEPSSQVWSLRYGVFLPTLLVMHPAYSVMSKMRVVHRVRGPPAFGSSIVTVLPASFAVLNTYLVNLWATSSVVMDEFQCPVCLEIRSVSLQMLAGVGVPTAMALAANYSFLKSHGYKVPKEVLSLDLVRWTGNMLSKCQGIIGRSVLSQAVAVMFMLYVQQRQWRGINQELERKIQQDQQKRPSGGDKPKVGIPDTIYNIGGGHR